MVVRNYTRHIHSNRALLDKFSRQIATGRRFNSFSEDNAGGIRSMNARRALNRVDTNIDNARAAQAHLRSAEGSLMQIVEISHTISERFVSALNDTNGEIDRGIMARELERFQEAMLGLANAQFSGRYVFGGTNTIAPPFTVCGDTGSLMYNGVLVNELSRDSNDQRIVNLLRDAAHIDIGMNVTFNNDANDPTRVDPQSAFSYTLRGIDFLGIGHDNLFDTTSKMIAWLRGETQFVDSAGNSVNVDAYDNEFGGQLLDQFRDAFTHLSTTIATLGADTQFLEFTIDRLLDEQLNLRTRQQELEMREPEEAILDFKMQEFIYHATLQMGQRLLQPTLFDFIR